MRYSPKRDIKIIRAHQQNGAYIASPSFSRYPYCWLRDGSFIAHAMTTAGQLDSAGEFHAWTADAINKLQEHVATLISAKQRGDVVDHARMLPARFTLAGNWVEDGWPSFQLDGYGQWLFSLEQYAQQRELVPDTLRAAHITAEYIRAFWNEPCFDVWEEGRTPAAHKHPRFALC